MNDFNSFGYGGNGYDPNYDYQLYLARANEKKQLSKNCLALGILLLLYEFLQFATGYVFDLVFVRITVGKWIFNLKELRAFFGENPQFNTTAFNMAYSAAVVASSFIVLMLVARAVFKVKLKSIFRFGREHTKTIAVCLPAVMLVNLAVSFIIGMVSFYFSQNGIYIPEADFSYSDASATAFFFQILYGVIVAPIVEEALYRGVVIHFLRPYGKRMAIIISSLVFGLMHGNLAQAVNGFCFALVMGTIAVYCNSIIPTIGIHMLNNALAQLPDIADILGSYQLYIAYDVIMLSCLVIGALVIFAYHKKIRLPKDEGCVLSSGQRYKTVLLSIPVLVYFCYIALIYIMSFYLWNR